LSTLNPIKRMLNQMSIKYKLFLLLLLISIIPLSLVSYSSEYFMFRSSTEYSASISSQYTEFVSREISEYIQKLNQSFDDLFSNSNFQRYLETPANDMARQANDIISFRPVIKNAMQFHPDVLGVLYLDQLGKSYFYSNQKTLDASFNFRADDLYNNVFKTVAPELLPPHPMNYVLYAKDRVFSYVWPIVNLNTGQTESWFIIEIKEGKLTEMLSSNGSEKSVGRLSLYHEPTNTNVTLDPMAEGIMGDFRKELAHLKEGSNHFLFESNHAEYEAAFHELGGGQWKIVWTAPLSSIEKGAQQSFILTIIIAAISLAIALVIAFPVMNKVINPLFLLKQGMQSLGRGSYVPIQLTNRSDEIGYLVKSYNQTLDKLQTMESEVYQAQIKEKEREVLQLQAQINPHFLFNTLETIESYAYRNNGEAVGDMVQSVSRMMRYSVRHNSGWATVKDELDYIRNFMTIHYYRSGQEVNADFDLDPEAMQLMIMKLSIQPYIENAFKYGWSPNMTVEEFKLYVSVRHTSEGLKIIVQDTGVGMSADTLGRLRQLIEDGGQTSDPFFRMHTGIYNAYRRFVLVYGSEASLQVESTPGEGTRIEMLVPATELSDAHRAGLLPSRS